MLSYLLVSLVDFYSPFPMLNYLLVSLVDFLFLCTYQYVDMLSSQIGMYQDAQSRKKKKKRGKKAINLILLCAWLMPDPERTDSLGKAVYLTLPIVF